ncbi:MAG: formate/nitrite transporter family protein [Lachnospiraceae bacterium]
MTNTEQTVSLPKQATEGIMKAGKERTNMPVGKMILLGIMAGIFIAMGAAASSMVSHGVDNGSIAKLMSGIVFPVGLMMIVLAGGELFTGDCMMIIGVLDRKYTLLSMIKVLLVVYAANFAGALLTAFLVSQSGQLDYTEGLLGAYTIKIAVSKISMSFGTSFVSGILCNILVCAAVLMSSAAKEISGKVLTIFFPIMVFVVSGYEHCVANMYFIPAGIFASDNSAYVEKAIELYGYTADKIGELSWQSFLVNNIFPVTLGNMAGGIIFVGLPLYLIHCKKSNEKRHMA